MKGSVFFKKDRGQWAVSVYVPGKKYPLMVSRYKGELMYTKAVAEKCKAMIQGDYERHLEGIAVFRPEKYTGKGWTDVLEYYEAWLKIKKKKAPATYKGYKSYYECHFKPFFSGRQIMLHEIQLDTLTALMFSLVNKKTGEPLSGKMKYNIMNCFHTFMDYAWRAKRIPEMPPFPKKEDYELQEKTVEWLSETDQMAVIEAMPKHHRPIFMWLKYHYRRTAEACALHKIDFDEINRVFTIRRSISARVLVAHTKTHTEHYVPCHPDFEQYIPGLIRPTDLAAARSPYLFINPLARRDGQRYSNDTLNRIWKAASIKAGVKVLTAYPGTKHSVCSQFINEKGGTDSELQMVTQHARIDSVKKYRAINTSRMLELISRKSKPTPKQLQTLNNSKK